VTNLRCITFTTAAVLTLLVSGVAALAQAQPAMLTLACKGTTMTPYIDEKPQAISMGIILNFTAGTVQGFGLPGMFDVPVRITAANDVTVAFEGSAVHLQITQTTIDKL
jgi:hypothetical protein